MPEAPTIPETPPGGGDPQAGRRALAEPSAEVIEAACEAWHHGQPIGWGHIVERFDGVARLHRERMRRALLAALRDREPPPDASWRGGAEAMREAVVAHHESQCRDHEAEEMWPDKRPSERAWHNQMAKLHRGLAGRASDLPLPEIRSLPPTGPASTGAVDA